MATIINILMITISVLLIGIILIQVRGQGGGLFGAAESSYRTRRGIELILFRVTILLVVLFVAISIVSASSWFGINS
ncbi:MAG: preprotein translocase subunit SecG [Chloroflexi bacterium]|nr:preprotein translocase subunit SecG [Chloroflexota bacterium]MBA14037.1 preprotein translocase subunit SecG [Chloroflexota bacterium]MBG55390.1 preprotein translocase subunit SecG [Chloroflexota bacterium]MBR48943.1 preprotein translocase subunit SecG [Chloroflexota bacterium]|tara:strand:- start:8758 stop:8988 length:231 start_codon:yes stop_codon:yes gene_type:complete